MSLRDRVTIITGAGRGIGRATARRFAHDGAQVVLFSRTSSHLDEVASEIIREGGRVLSVVGDVSREEDVHALFQKVMDSYGRVEILVNCAGMVAVRPFVEMDIGTWDAVLGAVRCYRQLFLALRRKRSREIPWIECVQRLKSGCGWTDRNSCS